MVAPRAALPHFSCVYSIFPRSTRLYAGSSASLAPGSIDTPFFCRYYIAISNMNNGGRDTRFPTAYRKQKE